MVRSKTSQIINFFSENKLFVILIIFSIVILTHRLGEVPIYLNQDELEFALNADSLAEDLHDRDGRFLPFYFWHLDTFWATPVIVYLTALIQVFTELSEFSIRLSSVFIGILSMFLIYLLSLEIFENKKYALLSAIFLIITPVFFIHSRILLDNLYTVPFVLLWLLFLKRFDNKKGTKNLFWAGLALGVGIHSYHAAKIIMPLYFLMSLVFLFVSKTRSKKPYLFLVSGFLIPILIFIPWLNKHPDTLTNQVTYVSGIDESIQADQGLRGVFNITRLKGFARSYISYFSSKILFFEGDFSLIHSTQKTGAFLMSIYAFLFIGIMEDVKRKKLFPVLILIGFLTYPIAPAIVDEPQRISRGLVVIPFLILLSVYGVHFMLNSKEKYLKLLFVVLMVLSIFQFTYFMNDYHRYYPMRSYSQFNNNLGGGIELAIEIAEKKNAKKIYLDNQVVFIDRYYSFYQKKNKIRLEKTTLSFQPNSENFENIEPGSIVLIRSDSVQNIPMNMVEHLEKVDTAREPDGSETFYVYYRNI